MEKYCEIPKDTLLQMQQKGLSMLIFFDEFCKKHSLRYFLCGGCCIGAVRNKGFIPWDDDVDIFMPRPDYEKLLSLWENSEQYSIQFPSKQLCTRNQFATIHDNTTTFIKTYQADLDINHGLALDILPLDGCPSGFSRKMQKIWALIYSLFVVEKAPENHGGLIKFAGKLALSLVPIRKWRVAIWKMAERKMSKYAFDTSEKITELCSGPGYMQNEYPKEAFEDCILADFEGHSFPIPKGYDTYLSMAFGDYMTPPPPQEQAAHHDFVVADMTRPYKHYKNGTPINPEDLKALQKASLDILLYFKEICEQNSLRFYLCGGCCIGAIRNKGFIPWDDDVDVFMPRPDYERLYKIWNEVADSERYTCVKTTPEHYTRLMHTCINDNNTTFIKTRQADLDTPHGVRLEIIPLDGCPSGFARKMQKAWALIFQIYNVGEPPTSKGALFKIIGKIMLMFTPTAKSRAKIWQFAQRKMSKYPFDEMEKTTELVTRWQYMKNEYPQSAFKEAVMVEFEGVEMPIPKGHDTYLSMAFGDYMTPPPPQEQIAKHDAVFYDLGLGYKYFKGDKYPRTKSTQL